MVKLGVAVPLITTAVLVTTALAAMATARSWGSKKQHQHKATQYWIVAEQPRPETPVCLPLRVEYVACECSGYEYSAYEAATLGRGCECECECECESSAFDAATLGSGRENESSAHPAAALEEEYETDNVDNDVVVYITTGCVDDAFVADEKVAFVSSGVISDAFESIDMSAKDVEHVSTTLQVAAEDALAQVKQRAIDTVVAVAVPAIKTLGWLVMIWLMECVKASCQLSMEQHSQADRAALQSRWW